MHPGSLPFDESRQRRKGEIEREREREREREKERERKGERERGRRRIRHQIYSKVTSFRTKERKLEFTKREAD
jgi:hypothetical protein